MSDLKARTHDVLIVSSSDKMSSFISKALSGKINGVVEVCGSASYARREMVSRRFDVVIINIPLNDEAATDLAIDLINAYDALITLIAPADKYEDITERVIEHGIVVLSKPVNARLIVRSTRLMCAIRDKLIREQRKTESLEDKMSEIRLVNRAKWILIERDGMTEDEAHRLIGKRAMDRGVSRRIIAGEIIEKE